METIWITLITVAGTVLVALVTGLLTALAGRKKASADVQLALNSGFTALVEQLAAQLKRQTAQIASLETKLDELRSTVEHLEAFIAAHGLIVPQMMKTTAAVISPAIKTPEP